MTISIYTNNHRRNLIKYWRQFYPNWTIPKGYHVHHIKPKCLFGDENDPIIHHPNNLIALHPDDHISIHRCRGDKFINNNFIVNGYDAVEKRKSDIDDNGLNWYERNAKKGVATARTNIDENGNDSYQREVIRQRNTLDENGVSLLELSSRKAAKTMRNDIVDGMDGIERSREKMVSSMRDNIDEDGNNGFQRARSQQKETMINDIDEDGLNAIERASIKRDITLDKNNNRYRLIEGQKKSIDVRNKNTHERNLKKYHLLYDKEYFKQFISNNGKIRYKECSKIFDITSYTLNKIRKYHNL